MSPHAFLGIGVVMIAGLLMGGGGWPIKVMKKFKYEHWSFIGSLMSLFAIPWVITLIGCPHALDAYKEVWKNDPGIIIKSNLFSLGWGVANVLCGLCFVRIGFALTGGILTGLGVSMGVIVPMVFKGSGLFKNAPDLGSASGLVVLAGVLVMLIGVLLTSFAGFGRARVLKTLEKTSGGFLGGLIMVVAAGILSCGISFSFVYSQGPIVHVMEARGASNFAANYAVWAVGLLGGAVINVVYPSYLLTKNKAWHVLLESWKEILLTLFMSVESVLSITLMGKGMLLLGPLGASIGFGLQQAMQMLGGQMVGFIGGEWRGVHGSPRKLMYAAIASLIVAAVVMASGNYLANPA